VIHIPSLGDPWDAIWETLIELQERQPDGWTLIGAQMVALHGMERDRTPPRRSHDADVLANVRAMQDATRRLSQVLVDQGFEMDPPNLDWLSHRFRSDRATIDLLAPDGVGERADLGTIPPAHTLEVPGGTQALGRSELVDVTLGTRVGLVPRPNLLGAIVLKACAVDVDDVPANQRGDLAFLLSLAANPRRLASQMTKGDRRAVRARQEMLDPRHPAWLAIEDPEAAQRVLRVLTAD
jgi:predicted nucleotidyltransferase